MKRSFTHRRARLRKHAANLQVHGEVNVRRSCPSCMDGILWPGASGQWCDSCPWTSENYSGETAGVFEVAA